MRLVEVEKLIRLYGHACELLDLRNALEQLFPSQPWLASGRVAQKFETILGIARQRSNAGDEMHALQHPRSLLCRRHSRHRDCRPKHQCREASHRLSTADSMLGDPKFL